MTHRGWWVGIGDEMAFSKYDFVPGDVCGYNCSAGMADDPDGEYMLSEEVDNALRLLGELADQVQCGHRACKELVKAVKRLAAKGEKDVSTKS